MFLPLFLFGAWYSENLVTSPVLFHPASLPTSLMSFIILFVLSYREIIPSAWDGVATFISMVLGIIVGLTTSAFLCRFTTISKIPNFIGKNTLGIYVAHSPIVGFFSTAIAFSSYNTNMISLLGVPFVSISAIFMSLGLKILLERVGFWWLYKLPGKHSRPLK